MSLDIIKEKGVELEKQQFDWRDLVRTPTSKLLTPGRADV